MAAKPVNAEERILSAIKKLGGVPGEVDPSSPVHPNIQRVVRADWSAGEPFRLKGEDAMVWGLHLRGGHMERGPRSFVQLGEYDGGNYTLFTFDHASEDPAVYSYDHEDFESETGTIRSSRRVASRLSSFLKDLRSEREKASPSKKEVQLSLQARLSPPGAPRRWRTPLMSTRPDGSFVLERDEGIAFMKRSGQGWTQAFIPFPWGESITGLVLHPQEDRFLLFSFEHASLFEREGDGFVECPLQVPESASGYGVSGEGLVSPKSAAFLGQRIAVGMNGRYSTFLYERGPDDRYVPTEELRAQDLGIDDRAFWSYLAAADGFLAVVGFNNAVYVVDLETRRAQTLEIRTPRGGSVDRIEAVVASPRYLLIGVPQDGESASGLEDKPASRFSPQVGAAYLFERGEDGRFVQLRCFKPKRAAQHRRFGACVGIAGDRFVACTAGPLNRETKTTVIQRGARGGFSYLAELEPHRHNGYDPHTHTAITQELVLEYHQDDDTVRVFALP